jgi:pyruvate kinase
MHRQRRVKIIATLGPASSSPEMIRALFVAGADVFRINMSHLKPDDLLPLVGMIRRCEMEMNRPIGILVDLQGPKLRIGQVAEHVSLEQGATFTLDQDAETLGDHTRAYLPHPDIFLAVHKDHHLLIDDGKLRLRVMSVSPTRIETKVITSGVLKSRKGVSVPDTLLPLSAMTPKDHADVAAALKTDIDWIALSFVQQVSDIVELKKITQGRVGIMAKIEKPQAIAALDEIIEEADAVMIARGDLGVELPLEQVPGLQKRITRLARRRGKPVVVATQMLESMIITPTPTRAEVSDVATAVFEGADAVMLSAESAAGHYPIESVATMNRIAEEVEQDPLHRTIINAQRSEPEATGADAIAAAARTMSETLGAKTIVAWTSSGATALRIARERPDAPILTLTPHAQIARRLALVWGVHGVMARDATDTDDMALRAGSYALDEGFAAKNDRVVVIAGVPFGTPGSTNLIRLLKI